MRAELRIVETPVASLCTGFLPDVRKAVLAYLDCIEDGSLNPQHALLISMDENGMVDIASFGPPIQNLAALGLLDIAKARLIEDARL